MGVIVVGYDDSDAAGAALHCAAELARGLGDRLVLAYGYAAAGPRRGEEVRELSAALREIGERALDAARERLRETGVEIETELVDARTAEALMEVAERYGARMIVVGSHGEGLLAAAVLGTTPYRLLQRSRIPVLVVPAAG